MDDFENSSDEGDLSKTNYSTILPWIHKLVVAFRSSPQREQKFKNLVAAPNIVPPNLTVTLDVSTRWNL